MAILPLPRDWLCPRHDAAGGLEYYDLRYPDVAVTGTPGRAMGEKGEREMPGRPSSDHGPGSKPVKFREFL